MSLPQGCAKDPFETPGLKGEQSDASFNHSQSPFNGNNDTFPELVMKPGEKVLLLAAELSSQLGTHSPRVESKNSSCWF